MKDTATPGFYAFLTDRVLRNTDQPQLYGTQPAFQGGAHPIAEPEKVDLRRHLVGLHEPLEDYWERLNSGQDLVPIREIIAHKPALPANYNTPHKIDPEPVLRFVDSIRQGNPVRITQRSVMGKFTTALEASAEASTPWAQRF